MKSFIYTFSWGHVDLLNARGRELSTLDKQIDEQCGTAEPYGRQKLKLENHPFGNDAGRQVLIVFELRIEVHNTTFLACAQHEIEREHTMQGS